MTNRSDPLEAARMANTAAAVARGLEEVEAFAVRSIDATCRANPDRADALRASLTRRVEHTLSLRAGRFESIGPYRPLRELGRGGQAIVYLAEDERLHRAVALKILIGFGAVSERAMARFKREAEVASRLDHAGVCTVYDAGVENGIPYIVMRFVEGETLAAKIASARERGVHSIEVDATVPDLEGAASQSTTFSSARAGVLRVVWMIEQVALALHAAHEAKIVHRDIKPGNVMLPANGPPVVVDFGLASVEESDLGLTRTGELFGTPAYMSPEQILAKRVPIDARTDVYALGVTLFECLTLSRPFDGPTRDAIYRAILYKEPIDPRTLNAAIPADLAVVIDKALEKDPDRRYHDAASFASDLRRVRELRPTAARPVSLFGRSWRWARRRPARALLVATLSVGLPLVAALLGYVWIRGPEIARGRALERAERIEAALDRGYLALLAGDSSGAIRAFDDASDDAQGTRAVAIIGGGAIARLTVEPMNAVRFLELHANAVDRSPSLRRMLVLAHRRAGNRGTAERLARPDEVIRELPGRFLAAVRALLLEEHDADAVSRAYETLASVLLETPRLRARHAAAASIAALRTRDLERAERMLTTIAERWEQEARVRAFVDRARKALEGGGSR